jgi:hypothetical protein
MVTTMNKPLGLKAKQTINLVTENSTRQVLSNGNIHWCDVDGKLHRDGGPAIESPGSKQWYQHGLLHREGGPAVMWLGGSEEWYQHGKLHCINGPAISLSTGHMEYYIKGQRFTEEEFYKYVDHLTGEVLVPPGKELCWQ